MTTNDIDAIEARANAATPGPWKLEHAYNEKCPTVCSGEPQEDNGLWIATMVGGYVYDDDAAFIADARQDVPALCAEVRELRAALDEARRVATGQTFRADQFKAALERARALVDEWREYSTDVRTDAATRAFYGFCSDSLAAALAGADGATESK